MAIITRLMLVGLRTSLVEASYYYRPVQDEADVDLFHGFQAFENEEDRHSLQDVDVELLEGSGPSALDALGRGVTSPTAQRCIRVNYQGGRGEL